MSDKLNDEKDATEEAPKPDLGALDDFMGKIVKVSKEELEQLLEDEARQKNKGPRKKDQK